MWEYSFMQHALIAGIIISTICAMVSVLVVLRRTAFASHALGHMSLTGAALSVVLGVPAMFGQLTLNIVASLVMGGMSDKVKKNDLVVGVVLTFVLGIGAYCLFLFQNNYAGGVMSILFGDILTVSNFQIVLLILLSIIILVLLAFIARPLIFVSLDPVLASSKNIPIRRLSILFFLILALTVSMACQVVGALLVFTLLIIPGAIGFQWADGIYKSTIISVVVANVSLILSLWVSFCFNLPTSFCLTTTLVAIYFLGLFKSMV